MDKKTQQGSLSESKVISYFIEKGYDVFIQFSGKSPFDLIICKNKKLQKVEVKSTIRRTKYDTGWAVGLKSTRSNKTTNTIHNFDNSKIDLLAVFIVPKNEVRIFNSKKITTKTELVILD